MSKSIYERQTCTVILTTGARLSDESNAQLDRRIVFVFAIIRTVIHRSTREHEKANKNSIELRNHIQLLNF